MKTVKPDKPLSKMGTIPILIIAMISAVIIITIGLCECIISILSKLRRKHQATQ